MSLPVPDTREAFEAQRCPSLPGRTHQPVGTHHEFYTDEAQTDRERKGHGWQFGDSFFISGAGEKEGTRYGMFLCWRCGLFYAGPARFQRSRREKDVRSIVARLLKDLLDAQALKRTLEGGDHRP